LLLIFLNTFIFLLLFLLFKFLDQLFLFLILL
jgi:hypothetical protein